jgi:hypothetical protein
VPILHAEEKVPITISIVEQTDLTKGNANLKPIFASGEEAQTGDSSFFLKTQVLTKKQKAAFA